MIYSKEDSSIPYSQALKVYKNANSPINFWTFGTGFHLSANILFFSTILSENMGEISRIGITKITIIFNIILVNYTIEKEKMKKI